MTAKSRWPWLFFGPIVLGALVLFTVTSFKPKLYRSSATIIVVPQQVPEAFVQPTITTSLDDRLLTIQSVILSRTKLEHIIEDLNLYQEERKRGVMQDVVEKMRSAIEIQMSQGAGRAGNGLTVAFTHSNSRVAQKVAEQLAGLFITESVQDRASSVENASQFLEGQIEEARRRLAELLKMKSETPVDAQLRALDVEMATDLYKRLLTKKQDSALATNLERRQIGEQFKLIDAARIPERPIGPSPLGSTIGGALIGAVVGLVLLVIAAVRRSAP